MAKQFRKRVVNPFDLLNLHLNVSRETHERFSRFHDLLIRWQNKINLISPDTVNDIWNRHILDSLQLANFISDRSKKIVDMGAGAGFPGLILAIYGYENVTLIESDAKKISFLKEASRITSTVVSLEHKRLEEVKLSSPDFILARACSELSSLLEYASLFISHETTCLFHKGKNYSKEIEDANEEWQFDHTLLPSVTSDQGVIVQLSQVRKRRP
jgi:16S rRNA (guanine527-N7)-methyltransferase